MLKRVLILLTISAWTVFVTCAQEDETTYVPPSDTLVARNLEKWSGLKFGLLMHWGTYSQWGIVESWSLCGEDEGWCARSGDYAGDYERYKRAYHDLMKTFNPVGFNPALWADAAEEAGMRYVIFTTKHHDGFCMFNTAQADYKITSAECPFASDKRADVTKEIFDAFRKKGMMAGAYFSKPDWNSDYYWWKYFPTPDRHMNYDPARYPERWKKFRQYTSSQIGELMSGYGRIDILWLDGAWVRPIADIPKKFESWAKKKDFDQDIGIPEIAATARMLQPGLIVVDRWVAGEYENYLTPENKVPDRALNVPWESCVPMATSWSYVKNDVYKPVGELIHLLVDVVAKGGNLLLNIAPSSEGEFDPDAYDRLKGIGRWMKVNAEAIYETKPVSPYKYKNICFTQKDDGTVYAIFLDTAKTGKLPESVTIPSSLLKSGSEVSLLGSGFSAEAEENQERDITIYIPDSVRNNPPCRYAWIFKIRVKK